MSPGHAVAFALGSAALARLWRVLRARRGHKHAWERIAVGPWQEAERERLPFVYDEDGEDAVSHCVLVADVDEYRGTAYEASDIENPAYKWYRTELVCCRCGVTHERFQVVTEKGIWVTE